MQIYVDLNSLSMQDNPDVSSFSGITFKRSTLQFVQIQFVSRGASASMLSGTTASLGLKSLGQWEGIFLCAILGMTSNPVSGFFEGYLNTNTTQIDAALQYGNVPPNDLSSTPCMAEIAWQSPGQAAPTRSNTVNGTINNCVITGLEGATTTAPTFWSSLQTSDPHTVGQLYRNGDYVVISNG